VANSLIAREEESLEALRATMVAVVAALRRGETLRLGVPLGEALQLVAARLVGEAVVAEHQVGVEMVDARLTVEVMEAGLHTVVMAHGQRMVEPRRMEVRHHTVEELHMAETMAHAPHMEASTQATAHLPGEVHLAMRPNHRVDFPLQPLVHITRQRRVRMRLPLLVLMGRTQHLHQVVPWMHPLPATSQPPRQEILVTSTAQHRQLHPHLVLGNPQRRRRVEKIQDTIEVMKVKKCRIKASNMRFS
jgi:hypothetical protein